MACSEVAGEKGGLQMWRVAVKILNNHSQTADKQ
jgi:hypothetical protein